MGLAAPGFGGVFFFLVFFFFFFLFFFFFFFFFLARRCSTSSRPNLTGLREVTGIGRVRAKRITDAWAEQKIVREIMVFLHSHGVGTAAAVRCAHTTRHMAPMRQVLTLETPYRLARDIRGIGFKTPTRSPLKLGIDKTAMIRVRAGDFLCLTKAMDDGHCGFAHR